MCASNFFGAVFSRLGTPTMITEFLMLLDLPPTAILLIIMALIFLLAWPLEWVPIVLIIIPIVLPLIEQLGFNLTWFGILVAVNLQTAWLSPPVALSAYFLKGVVPEWDLSDIYKGNDAVYGHSGYWISIDHYLPTNCTLASNILVWLIS